MTFAKGIANGMPVGATIATEEVANSWTGASISTYGGNPVSMAAMNATMNVMETENMPARAERLGKKVREMFEGFKEQYESQENLADIISIFGVLGIFIASLGLFGLASFTVQQRTKEIGIRKVLGASISSVWSLIIKDFGFLVLISNLIAWPTAYFVMKNVWLSDFPYRINPALTTFIVAGLISVLITLVTVSFQALSAAKANPVNAIQSE